MGGAIPDVDPVEYEVVGHATRGEIVAVQVRPPLPPGRTIPASDMPPGGSNNPPWYLFAGEVIETFRWDADIDPGALFVDDRHRSEDLPLASIHLDPKILWTITGDEVVDNSEEVTEVPPLTSNSNDHDAGPPPCILTYRSDQLVRLVVHESHAAGSEAYMPRVLGIVVESVSGALVDAKQVLPQGYDAPE